MEGVAVGSTLSCAPAASLPDGMMFTLATPGLEQRMSQLMAGLKPVMLQPMLMGAEQMRSTWCNGAGFSLSRQLATPSMHQARSSKQQPWRRAAAFASTTAAAAAAVAASPSLPLPALPPTPPPPPPSALPSPPVGPPVPKPLLSSSAQSGSSSSPYNNGSVWVTLACFTRKGLAPGYKQDNQDSMMVYETFALPSRTLLGVFDGHGFAGHKVSSFIREKLPLSIQRRLGEGATADDALASAFASVNESMETAPDQRNHGPLQCPGCGGECGGCRPACGFDAYNSGSTAVVSYLDGDVLTTAWAGDSRAVLGVERPRRGSSAPSTQQAPPVPPPTAPAQGASALASFFAGRAAPPAAAVPGVVDGTKDTAAAGTAGTAAAGGGPSSHSPASASTDGTSGKPSGSSSTSAPSTIAGSGASAAQNPSVSPKITASNSAFSWHAIELTRDHKPERPDERRRIMLYGGRVARTYSSSGVPQGPYRVWLRDYDYPGLAMSRALGDLAARPAGIICTPDVSQVVLPAGPRGGNGTVTAPGDIKVGGGGKPSRCFVVLASDGVWEFMSNSEVVDMVGARLAWQQERDRYHGAPGQHSRGKPGPSSAAPQASADGGPAAPRPAMWDFRIALDALRCGLGTTSAADHGPLTAAPSQRTDPLPIRPWFQPLLSKVGMAQEPSQTCASATAACQAVADESLARWTKEYGGQYVDDITVIVAQIEPL